MRSTYCPMEVRVNKMMRRSACAALLIVGCSQDDGGGKKPGREGPVARIDSPLQDLAGCDELAEVLRANALAEMNKNVDAVLEDYLSSSGGCWDDAQEDADYASGDGDSGDNGNSGGS